VRYADDWLIGMVSTRVEAVTIKDKIKGFLKENLKLELHEDKTLITNSSQSKAIFLGTEIRCPIYKEEKIINRKRKGKVYKQRKSSANTRMDMPVKRIIDKLKTAHICDGGGKAQPKYQWLGYTHKEIILAYNSIINGISNYYSFIENMSALARIYNILRSSAAKLLTAKYKLKTQRKTFQKFGAGLKSPEGTSLIVRKEWKKNPMGFKKNVNTDLSVIYTSRYTKSILHRICAICSSNVKVEMHHVKHIRKMNIKLSMMEKSMVSLNRKQIPVCRECHMDIHTGRYDGKSLKDIINTNEKNVSPTT
jgi:hypothetical protein